MICLPDLEILKPYEETIKELSEKYLEHKFNLLGSGWTEVYPGCHTKGLEGNRYEPIDFDLKEPNSKLSKQWIELNSTTANKKYALGTLDLISEGYRLLDWQLDFRSGWRWSSLEWHRDIKYGHIPGAEIKLPWEFGRMQHLPLLAYAAALSNAGMNGFQKSSVYANEFRNEILDFIAQNPPKLGAQWVTAMDVAIRAANWLVAYDMFIQTGADFDDKFIGMFTESIYNHAVFILENLEWSGGLRGNHYLSNITGLLIIAAYLPVSDDSTRWFAFALQELISETNYQFNADGGNFEASTAYHNFSAELVNFAFAFVLACDSSKISAFKNYSNTNWKYKRPLLPLHKQLFKISGNNVVLSNVFLEKLRKINEFSKAIIQPSGSILQIGDNDSGKLFNFVPDSKLMIDSVSTHNIEDDRKKSEKLNKSILKMVLQNSDLWKFLQDDEKIALHQNQFAFPDFGLYIFRNENYFLSVRCGSLGQRGKGGHAHNDQLSITLALKCGEMIVDPGTYLYTSLPKIRNQYRSTSMHNVIYVNNCEQNKFFEFGKDDLFWLFDNSHAKVRKFDSSGFMGEHTGYGKICRRQISIINDSEIHIHDVCRTDLQKKLRLFLHPEVSVRMESANSIVLSRQTSRLTIEFSNGEIRDYDYRYSPDYGMAITAKGLEINVNGFHIDWKIKIISA